MTKQKGHRRKSRYGPVPAIKPGAAPAELVESPDSPFPVIHVIGFGTEEFFEQEGVELADLKDLTSRAPVTWIHVTGIGDATRIEALGRAFDLHPLAVEDIMGGGHRPKIEEIGPYTFMILQTVEPDVHLKAVQLTLFFKERLVLTFMDGPGSCLEPVRDRIRRHRGLIRTSNSNYLAYAIMDAAVDQFYPVLDRYDEELAALEEKVVAIPERETVHRIHEVKRDLLTMRRTLWPLREVISELLTIELGRAPEMGPFLRDLYDHVVQAIDLVAAYREIGAALSDIYLSSLSQRLNEVMKTLTIVATIFIPLTFIVGLYGMNFDANISPFNMPELKLYYGYPAVLLLMAGIVAFMLLFFKRKKWLWSD